MRFFIEFKVQHFLIQKPNAILNQLQQNKEIGKSILKKIEWHKMPINFIGLGEMKSLIPIN